MAYTFNDSENKITKLLPAYIFNYSDDNGKGLFLFIKYLTNYIETANEALDTICSELNVNSSYTFILDILAKKLGVEIPTTITSVEDKQTVLKGKIMTISSTGCAQALIDTIYGLYPDWHNYDSFGTLIEVGNTLKQLFYNTKETPKLEGLGWDNVDETITTTDTDGFETVTKILNVLVSTAGPVVQLVQKTSNGLEGYSVIVHYTTEEDNVNVISYKDKDTCDIEDLVDSENKVMAISPAIDEVRSFITNQNTFYAISNNTYNYPDAKGMYYNDYKTIEHTNKWEEYNWQSGPGSINPTYIWKDNSGNVYYSTVGYQYKLDKQNLTWEWAEWKGLSQFWGSDIWSDGQNIYYSGRDTDNTAINYKLNGDTWEPKTWYGLDTLLSDGAYLKGSDIWSDGENIYFTSRFTKTDGTDVYYSYVLDKSTSIWSEKPWTGLTNIQRQFIFQYKDRIYYSSAISDNDSTSDYYQLDIDTSTWNRYNWGDGIYISGYGVWTDGENTYYNNEYKLNDSSFTWEPMTWTGLDGFNGLSIWVVDDNVFYSDTHRLGTVISDKVIVDRKRLNNNYQTVFITPEIGNDGDFQRKKFEDPNNTSQILADYTIYGDDIWKTSKGTVYYNDPSHSLYFYKQTGQFENKTWTLPEGTQLRYGKDIYTIDDSTYYTYSAGDTETPVNLQLTSDSTWIEKNWGTSDIRDGRKVWKTKDNTYYGDSYKFVDGLYFNSKSWEGLTKFYGKDIWESNNNIYYSTDTEQYKLERNRNNWTSISWPGYNKIIGSYVWKTDKAVYYSNGDIQYKLYSDPSRWISISWSDLTDFTGDNIWNDGNNTYYSNYTFINDQWTSQQYRLNEQLLKWEPITWNGYNSIIGSYVWKTYGGTIYYSDGNKSKKNYKLNIETSTWEDVGSLFTGDAPSIYGNNIWHDGLDTYYSSGETQLKFNNLTDKFERITCVSAPYYGNNIWHNGLDTYYSSGDAQYEKGDNKLPTAVTWSNIPNNFDPINIWHAGDKTYYSDGNIHKIINEDTMSFDDFTEWKGLTNFYGYNVWESKNNIYYSEQYKGHYILDIETNTWLPKSWVSNHIKDNSEIMASNYIWSDGIRTYYSNNYVLNDYTDSVSVACSFTDNKLSVKSQLTRKYTVNPLYYPIRLQALSYALDMIKLPNNLLGWHSPDGIKSPVTVVNNVTDKVPAYFEITKEKYQNEWGRYIAKNNEFNPIIKNAVSVIDEGSLLQGAKNMHYKVIIDVPGIKEDLEKQAIITKYLIPKFLGVGYEVEFK